MTMLLRASLVLAAMAAGICGVGLAQRNLLADIGSEFFDSQGLRQRIREESQLGQDLDRRFQAVMACNLGKTEAVEELLSNQISLAQAAARFQILDLGRAYRHEAMFRETFPGTTEEERYCRQVIAFVNGRRSESPEATFRNVARLKAELRSHIVGTDFLQDEEE